MVRKPPISRIDPHVAQWIFFLLSLFFFGIAILAGIGEWRGWWNLLGEIGMTVGTLAGMFLGAAAYLTGSSEGQVDRVHEAVVDNGRKLEKLDKLDKLDVIEDALIAEDGETSRLDRVQVELDRQTGVLTDIRDLL